MFTDLINEPVHTEKYQHVVKEELINVYRRDVEGKDVILIKSYSVLEYDREVIFKAISDAGIRKEWDKVFSEFRLIEANPEKEVLYMRIEVRC